MSSRPKGGPMGGGPGRNIGAKGPKPKNFWKTVKRLFRYMSKRTLSIIAVLVLAIAAVVFQIQTPKVLGQATTEIFKGVMKGAAEMKQGLKGNKILRLFKRLGLFETLKDIQTLLLRDDA